jgi:hypothetical protein
MNKLLATFQDKNLKGKSINYLSAVLSATILHEV